MSPRNAAEVGQRRHYTVPGADKPYPSVTTILKAYPAEWMGPWAAKMVAQRATTDLGALVNLSLTEGREAATKWLKAAPWEKRDVAREAGTDAHQYLEDRLKGAPTVFTTPKVEEWMTPQEAGVLAAIDDFLDTYRPDPLHIEAQIASETHEYAGSGDLIADIYGRRGLIDLKTGTISAKDRLQLAAYRHGDFLFDGDERLAAVPLVDFCAVLHVPKDDPNSWQLIEVTAAAWEFKTFLAVKEVFDYAETFKKGIGGTLILPQAVEEAA